MQCNWAMLFVRLFMGGVSLLWYRVSCFWLSGPYSLVRPYLYFVLARGPSNNLRAQSSNFFALCDSSWLVSARKSPMTRLILVFYWFGCGYISWYSIFLFTLRCRAQVSSWLFAWISSCSCVYVSCYKDYLIKEPAHVCFLWVAANYVVILSLCFIYCHMHDQLLLIRY